MVRQVHIPKSMSTYYVPTCVKNTKYRIHTYIISLFSEKKLQARWKTVRDSYTIVKASFQGYSSVDTGIIDEVATPDTNTYGEVAISRTCNGEDENDTPNRETQSINKPKRKNTLSPTTFEIELLQCIKNKNYEENDQDFIFFKSILPNIKKFSSYQKLKFRSKVLSILSDIEKENVTTLEDLSSTYRTS